MTEEVTEIVQEWLSKAESNWATVRILAAAEDCPFDIACFHCQQHVEKLLKALLTLHAVEFPKTHALVELIDLPLPAAPDLSLLREDARVLTEHAVRTRYPGSTVTTDSLRMREMISICERFAAVLLPKLPRPKNRP